MPVRPPSLDDRSYQDLLEELLARIPAHTPEWTNPRLGDPGRTLIELFAWLADTLLYRANLIPERQRLAFLRLLGLPMRPAIPARGLITLSITDTAPVETVVAPLAVLKGPVNFETRGEITVLPVTAEACYKRPLSSAEAKDMTALMAGLVEIYRLKGRAKPYVTTPIFALDAPEPDGFDLMTRTADKSLWLALLAAKGANVDDVRKALGKSATGGQQLISIGVVPTVTVPALSDAISARMPIPHVWEISAKNQKGELEYLALEPLPGSDSTHGLTRQGVMRLILPASSLISAPSNDVRQNLDAGVGDRPPRLDDAAKAARLVAWLRLRPTVKDLHGLSLSWVGVNAVEIDQRKTTAGVVIGQSDGSADQELSLRVTSVDPDTLQLQVEEEGRGYQRWLRVDDLALAGRDTGAFKLDAEAGTVRFGDGVRGRIPQATRRIRVAFMRSGGGAAGNLPAGALTQISAKGLDGQPITRLKAAQPLPTQGGEDAETIDAAERRIPSLFRNRDRAVTADDYKVLAATTPGLRVGRVEVIPRFKPHKRQSNVPGVVSVMVLPWVAPPSPPYPRPDRPFIESVYAHLDPRRPLATELYVIGCEYIPIGMSVGVSIQDGAEREAVLKAVRDTVRHFFWPLAPGGIDGAGWTLGRTVRDRELEVVVARVTGITGVSNVNLFQRQDKDWRMVQRGHANAPVEITLQPWQLPELLSLVVVADQEAPKDLKGVPNPFADDAAAGVAVPVVPEVC